MEGHRYRGDGETRLWEGPFALGVRRADARTVAAALEVLAGRSRRGLLGRLIPFLGPAFVASVAYMDPGNFATNIQAGARYGYLLLWVVLASNLMAMLVQYLSAKLGMATGRNLAQLCRDQFPRPVVWGMWAVAEVVAMATDLAEFVGAAVALNLLFHIPLPMAGLVTGLITFIILQIEQAGFRPLEMVIMLFVAVIGLSYLAELFLIRPDPARIAQHIFIPRFSDTESMLLASGILGATVMPHVIFLHSALTQNRIPIADVERKRRLLRMERIDVVIAMGIGGLLNAAIMIAAAAAFHFAGLPEIGTLEEAYRTLIPLLGPLAGVLFAVALLASGLSSSVVGTMAGQEIMQGFLHRRIPVGVRRLVTMLPSMVALGIGWDPTRSLVISQVVLSFGIPFALVPLILFTAREDLMGPLRNRPLTTALAGLVATLVIALNLFLLYRLLHGSPV